MEQKEVSLIARALGDATRLGIVLLLTGRRDGMCGCDILKECGVTQPTLSHHMKVLSQSGLVRVRKEGRWCYYSLDCRTLKSFQSFIASLSCPKRRLKETHREEKN